MSATPHDIEAGSIALAQAPLLVVPLRFAIWERAAGRDFAPTAASLSALFLPAPVPGALAYTGYNFIAGKLGPARACMLLYMAPVDAAVPAWIVLGERLGWFHIAGAALVIAGIYAAPRFAVKPPVPAK
jgi:drug/metabolite transporter (DMT)-like permease